MVRLERLRVTVIKFDNRPGILASLWACALGVGQVAFWPSLPGTLDTANVAILALLVIGVLGLVTGLVTGQSQTGASLFPRLFYWLLLPLLFGTGWALKSNHQSLIERLSEDLHGSDHLVTVEIISLPQSAPAVSFFGTPSGATRGYLDARFRARIVKAEDPRFLNQRLQLGWYRMTPKDAERLRAGSRWTMRVRVKQPRGSANPHTFDYEAWLLEQGVFATGYVRDKDQMPIFLAPGEGIDALREDIRSQLAGSSGAPAFQQAPLMRALLLGDRGGIDEETRQLLQRTGTAHLLAISGLHVGMVAGCFFLVGGLLARVIGLTGAGLPGNPLLLAGSAGLLGALLYTLISGAPLSAQRALLMTGVAIVALASRRRIDGQLALALAVCGVLLWQPLAVLNAGFWLSFIAVASLLLRFQGRVRIEGEPGSPAKPGGWSRRLHALWLWLLNSARSQWVILIGLLIPSVLIFQGVSLSGLAINLVAIPWVGLTILPLLLLGTLCPFDPLAAGLWTLADWQLGWLLTFLDVTDRAAPGWHSLPVPGFWVVVLAGFSGLALLLPKGVPGRSLGWLLFPVIAVGASPWQRPLPEALALTVLDVGQGLAVTAVTGEQSLIFDTGASTGSGWSAGANIVAPFLQAQGQGHVDALIVSHGDRDHAGGVEGVLSLLDVEQLFAPGMLGQKLIRQTRGTGQAASTVMGQCLAGKRSQFGELTVDWLWPRTVGLDGEENDHSCVGLLTWRDTRILLTGDISRKVEAQLKAMYPAFLPVDLLVAPHHGSRTSSSSALLQWAKPARVVFSAGYRHQFGHPHPNVVSRYQEFGSAQFNTAELGAVQFIWGVGDTVPRVACARNANRFWLDTLMPTVCK